jgi:hypothetical protein
MLQKDNIYLIDASRPSYIIFLPFKTLHSLLLQPSDARKHPKKEKQTAIPLLD